VNVEEFKRNHGDPLMSVTIKMVKTVEDACATLDYIIKDRFDYSLLVFALVYESEDGTSNILLDYFCVTMVDHYTNIFDMIGNLLACCKENVCTDICLDSNRVLLRAYQSDEWFKRVRNEMKR